MAQRFRLEPGWLPRGSWGAVTATAAYRIRRNILGIEVYEVVTDAPTIVNLTQPRALEPGRVADGRRPLRDPRRRPGTARGRPGHPPPLSVAGTPSTCANGHASVRRWRGSHRGLPHPPLHRGGGRHARHRRGRRTGFRALDEAAHRPARRAALHRNGLRETSELTHVECRSRPSSFRHAQPAELGSAGAPAPGERYVSRTGVAPRHWPATALWTRHGRERAVDGDARSRPERLRRRGRPNPRLHPERVAIGQRKSVARPISPR